MCLQNDTCEHHRQHENRFIRPLQLVHSSIFSSQLKHAKLNKQQHREKKNITSKSSTNKIKIIWFVPQLICFAEENTQEIPNKIKLKNFQSQNNRRFLDNKQFYRQIFGQSNTDSDCVREREGVYVIQNALIKLTSAIQWKTNFKQLKHSRQSVLLSKWTRKKKKQMTEYKK